MPRYFGTTFLYGWVCTIFFPFFILTFENVICLFLIRNISSDRQNVCWGSVWSGRGEGHHGPHHHDPLHSGEDQEQCGGEGEVPLEDRRGRLLGGISFLGLLPSGKIACGYFRNIVGQFARVLGTFPLQARVGWNIFSLTRKLSSTAGEVRGGGQWPDWPRVRPTSADMCTSLGFFLSWI